MPKVYFPKPLSNWTGHSRGIQLYGTLMSRLVDRALDRLVRSVCRGQCPSGEVKEMRWHHLSGKAHRVRLPCPWPTASERTLTDLNLGTLSQSCGMIRGSVRRTHGDRYPFRSSHSVRASAAISCCVCALIRLSFRSVDARKRASVMSDGTRMERVTKLRLSLIHISEPTRPY